MKKLGITLLKETLVEMIISAVLLAVLSFVVLKISPSLSVVKTLILAIYGISTFCGGVIMGKVMETKKYLWGAIAGVLYFLLIIAIAFIVKGNVEAGTVGIMSGFVVAVVAGTIGGMIS